MDLLNQWVGVVHVERLSERGSTSVGRPIKKRTAMEIGVDERYSSCGDGLLLVGEWAEGSLEAKQRQEGKVNHGRQGNGEVGNSERGNEFRRAVHMIRRRDPL